MSKIVAALREQTQAAALTETRASALINLASGLADRNFTGTHYILTLLTKACEESMPLPAVMPFAEAMYDYMCSKYIPDVVMPDLHVSGVLYTGKSPQDGGGTTITLEPDAGAITARAFAVIGKAWSHGHYSLTEEGVLNFYPEVEEPLPSDEIMSVNYKLATELEKGEGWRITKNGSCELNGALIVDATIDGPVNTYTPGEPIPRVQNFVPEGNKTLLYESSTYKPFGGKRIYSCDDGSYLIVSCDEDGQARVAMTTSEQIAVEEIEVQTLIDRNREKSKGKKARIAALEAKVEQLKAELAAYADGTHMNNSGTLPPVDCDLLIKMPAGEYEHAEVEGLVLTIDSDVDMRVRRSCHVQSRGQDLTYVMYRGMKELFRFKGQFDWTYP
ncbi:hypothetical protein [Pseudomonas sp.]|uniref:hypothetical protein n=1 Tax=Pseudomonas sp. TaxID=306 RepID=UPI003FD8FC31